MILQINNWLWQGSISAIKDKDYLKHNIKGIVFLGENNERVFPDYADNVDYLWCPFNDPGENLTAKKIEEIMGFASDIKVEGSVLVACFGGINRSSAICAIVLHYIESMKEKEACNLIRKKNPSMGIRKELTEKIKTLLGLNIS